MNPPGPDNMALRAAVLAAGKRNPRTFAELQKVVASLARLRSKLERLGVDMRSLKDERRSVAPAGASSEEVTP